MTTLVARARGQLRAPRRARRRVARRRARRPHRRRRPERHRQVDAAADLAGLIVPDAGDGHHLAATATVGYLAQEPERVAGEAVRTRSPGAPAWRPPPTSCTPPPTPWRRRRRRRRPLRRGPRALAGARRRRPRRPGRRGVGRPRPRPGAARPARPSLLSGGEAARGLAGGDPALALRRAPARRAHQRPRLRRPRPARALRRRGSRRRVRGEPRPGLPRPHGHRGARARRARRTGRPVRGRLGRPTSTSARRPAATPRRPTTSSPTSATAPGRARRSASGRDPAWQEAKRTRPTTTRSSGARAERTEKQAAKVRQSEKALDRLDAVEKPWEALGAALEIGGASQRRRDGPPRGRGGRAGTFALGPVDLEIGWAERVAILGPNGSGKSTLLGALLGRLPLDAGERWLGPGVVVGELDQGAAPARADRRCSTPSWRRGWDLVRAGGPSPLAKFGLGADHVARPRRRCRRASAPGPTWPCSRPGANCLVLDEPTNHLDLPAIEQLEQAVEALRRHRAARHPRPPAARGRHRHPHPPRRRRQGEGRNASAARGGARTRSPPTRRPSANKIHDDEVARQYGFRGGLVPGSTLRLPTPAGGGAGPDLAERGRCRPGSARSTTVTGWRSCRRATAASCATSGGWAHRRRRLAGRRGRGPTRRWPEVERRRPRAVRRRPWCRAPPSGSPHTFHADRAAEYLADVRGLPPLRPSGSPTPAGSRATPTTCSRPTCASARGSTSSRAVQHPSRHDGESCRRPGARRRRVGGQGPPVRHPDVLYLAGARRRPHHPHRHLPGGGTGGSHGGCPAQGGQTATNHSHRARPGPRGSASSWRSSASAPTASAFSWSLREGGGFWAPREKSLVLNHYAFLVCEDEFDAIFGQHRSGHLAAGRRSLGSQRPPAAMALLGTPTATGWRSSPPPTAVGPATPPSSLLPAEDRDVRVISHGCRRLHP